MVDRFAAGQLIFKSKHSLNHYLDVKSIILSFILFREYSSN